jgi:uncharacterized membrane protein
LLQRQKKEEELIKNLKQEKDIALTNVQEDSKQKQRSFKLTIDTKNEKIKTLEVLIILVIIL